MSVDARARASSDGGGDAHTDVAPPSDAPVREDAMRPGTLAPVALRCGVLPECTVLSDFHVPPAKLHTRTAENTSWTDSGKQARMSSSTVRMPQSASC